MTGLIGLGVGAFVAYTVDRAGGPFWMWVAFVLSYWLVYRWGRRAAGAGATATATAVAAASAESSSSAQVQVFVNLPGGGPGRSDTWDSVAWRTDGRAREVAAAAELEGLSREFDPEHIDALDPVELVERIQSGIVDPEINP